MQTKKQSLKEALYNTAWGFGVSIAGAFLINRIHQIDIPTWKTFSMTMCFTTISIVRNYIIRRWFNKKELSPLPKYVTGVDPYRPSDEAYNEHRIYVNKVINEKKQEGNIQGSSLD